MAAPNRRKANVVDALVDQLALSVLGGELAPGARLPSVRALAERHGVNVSTIQRVLAALEERGIVAARARSGVVVLDPVRHGGAALWPLLLRHATAHPERALALVQDALETRRVLAMHVGRTLATLPFARYGAELLASIERFAEQVREGPRELGAIGDRENEILRTALLAAGKVAVLGVYNDIAGLLRASAALQQAFYRDPRLNLAGWRAFAEMLRAGGSHDRLGFIEPLLGSLDERVVRAYATSLGLSRPTPKPQKPRPARPSRTRSKS